MEAYMHTDEHGWLSRVFFVAALMGIAVPAWAQGDDRGERYRSEEAREAYRRGYEEGFARGYRKGQDEGEQRAPILVPPPPPAPPPNVPTGPIRVSGAYYGTSEKNCEATAYTASRANGKRSYSFEVTNKICGDPAPGDRKSLEVTYYCGRLSKTASANEHRTIYLDCN
jgi:hypothetical protein